jgi:hypothetical protein
MTSHNVMSRKIWLRISDDNACPLTQAAPGSMSANRILGDGRHRVAITQFTLLSQNGRPSGISSFANLDELCRWVASAGYDGLELATVGSAARRIPECSFCEPRFHCLSM